MPGYSLSREDYLRRLNRIEGQVRGISGMIEQDRYCIDVLTQIASVTKALEAVGLGLLDEHLRHCVVHAAETGGDEADARLDEAMAAVKRLLNS
jgi:CsoR family transcriptional regulator, copper-sensing transcriptional repressor